MDISKIEYNIIKKNKDMKKSFFIKMRTFLQLLGLLSIISCGGPINTVGDSHFDDDGNLADSTSITFFAPKQPKNVKFYVEVSGSMNGFFRPNRPTNFKADLWNILSYYSAIAPKVCILTNDGDEGAEMSQAQFQTNMNTGAFVSTASTKVPLMLQAIISNLNADAGEVAVLVSDMKYSPVGASAPEVLLTQYSTDISKILGTYGKAVSLICATSDFLDKNGNDVAAGRSPYYFFIMGNSEEVAEMRNGISTLLENRGHFVDNIESGFNYGKPAHSFGLSEMCDQPYDDQPTFVDYEDEVDGDTCTIKLKVNLENYRWIVSNEQIFKNCFQVKALYGSVVRVGNIKIETQNITDKELKRVSTAIVELKLSNMAMDSEVLEWTLELPDSDYTLFNEFFENANDENDPTKSFSVYDFVKGIFYGGVVNKKLDSNYILISKKS